MNAMKVTNNKKEYIDLLLLADESETMVDKYLERGDMFVLEDNGVKAECVVTKEEDGVYELKNIAVLPEYWRKGYGRQLISYIFKYYIDCRIMYVGTGDCFSTLNFYKSCGFTESHRVKNFFTDNYDHAMYEDGVQLVDMVYLKREPSIVIRLERPDEYREVENLVRESFWNIYRPGCLEHYVLNQLRNDAAFVKQLDFVMEENGKIIGQNMFMNANIKTDDGRDIPIMTMGPICITPELKRKGYGKILLDATIEKAKEVGCKALCFEGNIDFYGKSGFRCASEFGIRYHGLQEGEDASFFLCKELEPGYFNGITGEYATPQGYFVDEIKAEEFDKFFPPKEKRKLTGQIFN